MIVYRLGRLPSEDAPEGEDWDEYFSSLAAAKVRRRELIREDPDLVGHPTKRDFEIEATELANLPKKKLALALLNREHYVAGRTVVVPHYRPPGDVSDADEDK